MAKNRPSIKDPDLAKVGVALKRAALKARELGFATNTPVYVFREGKIIDIVAERRATRLPKKVGRNGAGLSTPRLGRKPLHKRNGKSR